MKARDFLWSLPKRSKMPWEKLLPRASSAELIDLLDKLLTFDPNKRIGVNDALAHPYLKVSHQFQRRISSYWHYLQQKIADAPFTTLQYF